MVSNCLVCCLLCLALHYTCDLDSYVGLIETEVMLCFLKMNRLGCGLVNNCLVGCLFCLTCCLFADFCVCLYPSSEGSLQLRLWMAFRLTRVVSFVACPCMCNEYLSLPKKIIIKKKKKKSQPTAGSATTNSACPAAPAAFLTPQQEPLMLSAGITKVAHLQLSLRLQQPQLLALKLPTTAAGTEVAFSLVGTSSSMARRCQLSPSSHLVSSSFGLRQAAHSRCSDKPASHREPPSATSTDPIRACLQPQPCPSHLLGPL